MVDGTSAIPMPALRVKGKARKSRAAAKPKMPNVPRELHDNPNILRRIAQFGIDLVNEPKTLTVVGQLNLNGQQTDRQHDAASRYHSLYHGAGCCDLSPKDRIGQYGADSFRESKTPEEIDEQCSITKERFQAAQSVIKQEGVLCSFITKSVCADNRGLDSFRFNARAVNADITRINLSASPQKALEVLKSGLDALADLWGLPEDDKKTDISGHGDRWEPALDDSTR